MSVYKVERKVDTVIVEMDISTAELLTEILSQTADQLRPGPGAGDVGVLFNRLIDDANVRWPSPLFVADTGFHNIQLKNRL